MSRKIKNWSWKWSPMKIGVQFWDVEWLIQTLLVIHILILQSALPARYNLSRECKKVMKNACCKIYGKLIKVHLPSLTTDHSMPADNCCSSSERGYVNDCKHGMIFSPNPDDGEDQELIGASILLIYGLLFFMFMFPWNIWKKTQVIYLFQDISTIAPHP